MKTNIEILALIEKHLNLVKEDMQRDESCTDKTWYKLIGERDALDHLLLKINDRGTDALLSNEILEEMVERELESYAQH